MTFSIERLQSGGIARFCAMNAPFGAAFEDHESYCAAPPTDSYVEALLAKDAMFALVAEQGDGVSRLDRNEPGLNDVAPGDERDTTSPVAMAQTLRRFLLEDGVLAAAHREKLIGWMVESPTGRERLRAGFPSDWRVGGKTGTWNGEHNAANDVALAWPPNRAPIIVAAYLHRSTAEPAARNAAHAEIARIVTEEWG